MGETSDGVGNNGGFISNFGGSWFENGLKLEFLCSHTWRYICSV